MGKEEMSDLIELILAFGAEHGVTFTDVKQNKRGAEIAKEGWKPDEL
jgi:hypothetical protein